MNEQERAKHFSIEIDQLLESPTQFVAEETTMSKDDQALLELAQTLTKMDLSPQSHFLRRLRQERGNKMKTKLSYSYGQRRLALAFGALALLLGLTLFVLTPAHTLANEWWQSLFSHHDDDVLTLAEPFAVSAAPTATPIPVIEHRPALSLAEAAALAGYAVKEADYLPDGYTLAGVYHDPEDQAVTLLYLNQDWLGITVRQEPAVMAAAWVVGETAVVESVQIGQLRGEYIRGEWTVAGYRDGANFIVEGGVWDAEGPLQQLRWIDEQMVYTIGTTSGQETGLQMADLLMIANSLR